jgi:predicted porin
VVDHGQRNAVDSQNSYLGFRGERKLGGALKAIWQIEQSVALDTGDAAWSNRNSFAGLSHGTLGTVKLGNMDTIYKEYGDTDADVRHRQRQLHLGEQRAVATSAIGRQQNARFHERRPKLRPVPDRRLAASGRLQNGPTSQGRIRVVAERNSWSMV